MSELKIPLCRSEFLQDFAISLARNTGWHAIEVGFSEHDGEQLEQLCVWVRTPYSTEVCLNLWEDKTIWVSVAQLPRNGANLEISFYPDFALLGFERVIEAFGESISVSTRLCYDESPEPLLRQIWNFSGEVEIDGAI